jgi:ribosomal protein S18 acetylase RimI-like enzyme
MFLPGRDGVNPTPCIWADAPGLSPRCCGLAVRFALAQSGAMTPQLATDPALWPPILALLQAAFAYMEGRIDPPSSLRDLTPEALTRQSEVGEIWVIGAPVACVFLTPQPGALYVGKLAVAASHRGQGLARRLIDLAEARARVLRLPVLELQTRVELVENQAAFRAMGFEEVGRTAHPGYDRPTSITYRRPVAF